MTELIPIRRRADNDSALVFVHGFTGEIRKTWGRFPEFLTAEPRLAGWDLACFGYRSRPWLDLRRLWSGDPGLPEVATLLATTAANGALHGYRRLAFAAHSMGGLAVQRALLDSAPLRERTHAVVLFGTPSNGLRKASLLAFWKTQAAQMRRLSPFVRDLRVRWQNALANPPFRFLAVAGEEDQFVPPESSLGPFTGAGQRAVVPGNHVTMIKPRSAGDLAVRLVMEAVAEPDELPVAGADRLGIHAGRHKRRWLERRDTEDALEARRLYAEGYAQAQQAGDAAGAAYHGINLAFLALAFEEDYRKARQLAQDALGWCAATDAHPGRRMWLEATRGEALLITGDYEAALERYWRAIEYQPTPGERETMRTQAQALARLLRAANCEQRLERLFAN
jgi:hypothetical protein